MDMDRYLGLFAAEAREHLGAAYDLAAALPPGASDSAALRDLFRHVHSVKGMAASMGYSAMTALAHEAESLMERIRAHDLAPSDEVLGTLCGALQCLERMIDAAEAGAAVEDAERAVHQDSLRRLIDRAAPVPADSAPATRWAAWASSSPSGAPEAAGCVETAMVVRREGSFPAIAAATVLGKLGRLGRIVLTEPSMASLRTGRFDGKLVARLVSARPMAEVAEAITRIDEIESFTLVPAAYSPARAVPKGPAASLRIRTDRVEALFEDALDVMTTLRRLEARLEGAPGLSPERRDASSARVLSRRLYDGLVDVRLVSFETAAQRLERASAEAARALGKRIAFSVRGRSLRIDRGALDGVVDPLLHMVRNAVDHGIETPSAREAAGKPAEGRVVVSLQRHGVRCRLTVEDDGAGSRPARLRQAAVAQGLLSAGEADGLSDADAFQLVTRPGFSTAKAPSPMSGRGVGMDVVKAAVDAIAGHLVIHAVPGRGTRFEILFGGGVSLVQTFLVRSDGDLYAVPSAGIARVVVLDEATATREDGRIHWTSGGDDIPLVSLQEALCRLAPDPGPTRGSVLVFAPPDGGRWGMAVDSIEGRRELVVRPLPGPLSSLLGYSGCAVLDDGSIALVIDPSGDDVPVRRDGSATS